MYLDHNQLEGNIPTAFGKLEDITELKLNENKFNGQIPTELGRCFRLVNLHAEGNNFSGEIPSHLGRLSDLQNLRLHENSFNGVSVPPEICALKDNEDLSTVKVDCAPKVTCDCCDDCASS
jgi:Leucine-rich repeat (LRR) protein